MPIDCVRDLALFGGKKIAQYRVTKNTHHKSKHPVKGIQMVGTSGDLDIVSGGAIGKRNQVDAVAQAWEIGGHGHDERE